MSRPRVQPDDKHRLSRAAKQIRHESPEVPPASGSGGIVHHDVLNHEVAGKLPRIDRWSHAAVGNPFGWDTILLLTSIEHHLKQQSVPPLSLFPSCPEAHPPEDERGFQIAMKAERCGHGELRSLGGLRPAGIALQASEIAINLLAF